MTPVDRSAIYLGKLLGNLIFLTLILAVNLAALAVFFNLDLFPQLHRITTVLGLTVPGFVAVGTLYAALTANMRLREILLPILLFPVSVPVIIAAVKSLQGVFAGQPLAQIAGWLKLLAAYDVIIIAVGVMTFEYILGETE
jgi:heme exporter protein B